MNNEKKNLFITTAVISVVVSAIVSSLVYLFIGSRNNTENVSSVSEPETTLLEEKPAEDKPAEPEKSSALPKVTPQTTVAPKPTQQSTTPTTTVKPPVPQPKIYSMNISNFAFSQPSLPITKGDTVKWTNKDAAPHTVTSTSGSELASSELSQGAVYSHTFNNIGTFPYFCAYHPSMKGTVIVK
ncbi:MAG: cupredoxin family copper-binding protein [Patescibacteria group bacterium]